MALSALRLRRALLPLSSTFAALRVVSSCPAVARPNSTVDRSLRRHQISQAAFFRSSSALPLDRRGGGESKIDPNEILFEGCDYNHWLITMDFPKDPKPTPEEMVETYVQTCANVVGSREEAMKRIYACSTTTYTGFQVEMSEEMSEKFRGLPGVVFILPDSYIDPANKEYGGDKYEMGKITPRPPPVQYGRQGRYGDRPRNYDRPRYNSRARDSVPEQGNQPYNYQGPAQGDGRSYAPRQNYNPNRPSDGRSYGQEQNYSVMGQQRNAQYDQQAPPQRGMESYAAQRNYNPMEQQGMLHGHHGPVHARQNYYPGGQQDGQVANYPNRPMENSYGLPGNSSYGQQGRVSEEERYHIPQRNYGPPSGPGRESLMSMKRSDYSQYAADGQGNFNPHLFTNDNQGPQ